MRVKGLAALALLCLAAAGSAQTFSEYLKVRKQFGITQAASPAALETFIGERVLEIRGILKGTIGSDGTVTLILDNPDPKGDELYVRAAQAPDWMQGGSMPVRLIVRARRESENSMIRSELVAATTEQLISDHEARTAPKPAPRATTAQPTRGTSTSRESNVPRGAIDVLEPKARTRELSPEVRALVPVYADFIRGYNRRLSQAQATDIAETILQFSVYYGVDARLIVALIMTESSFNPSTVSHAGARGLGQLMPGTARMLGVNNSFDTEQNLYGTVKLLRQHLDTYTSRTGDTLQGLILALAAYNAGPGAVRRHGGVPPFRETQNYVRKVIERYRKLAGLE